MIIREETAEHWGPLCYHGCWGMGQCAEAEATLLKEGHSESPDFVSKGSVIILLLSTPKNFRIIFLIKRNLFLF